MLMQSISLYHSIFSFYKDVTYLFQIYPIWLCPFKLPPNPGMLHPPNDAETLFVDIGTYGVPKVNNFEPVATTRRIEEFVRKVKGLVCFVLFLFILLFLMMYLLTGILLLQQTCVCKKERNRKCYDINHSYSFSFSYAAGHSVVTIHQ